MRYLEVMYKCRCMGKEATVLMPERQPDEEIVDFMERVQHKLAADHIVRSPQCKAEAMEYAKVPVDRKRDLIGGAEGGTA